MAKREVALNGGAIRRARVPINNRCVAPTVSATALRRAASSCNAWIPFGGRDVGGRRKAREEEQAERDMLH